MNLWQRLAAARERRADDRWREDIRRRLLTGIRTGDGRAARRALNDLIEQQARDEDAAARAAVVEAERITRRVKR